MLPAVRTDEEWQAVVFDETVVRPAAEDLAARLGLAGAGLRRYPGGSRPVYAVGDRLVLKLYPTVSAPDEGPDPGPRQVPCDRPRVTIGSEQGHRGGIRAGCGGDRTAGASWCRSRSWRR